MKVSTHVIEACALYRVHVQVLQTSTEIIPQFTFVYTTGHYDGAYY
jgi:hypothetical protein